MSIVTVYFMVDKNAAIYHFIENGDITDFMLCTNH